MTAPGAKLFVGCLPYSKTEADLTPVFAQFGPIVEIALLKKKDDSSKGAAFVTYQSPHAAQTALMCLQNYSFPGSTRGINISIANSGGGGGGCSGAGGCGAYGGGCGAYGGGCGGGFGRGCVGGGGGCWGGCAQAQQMQMLPSQPNFQPWQHNGPCQAPMFSNPNAQAFPNAWPQRAAQPPPPPGRPGQPAQTQPSRGAGGEKVFVGQLPYSKNENDLLQLFSAIAPVVEVKLLRDKTDQKKGAAFVRFSAPNQADAAVSALDGFTFTGSPRPISVSIASSGAADALSGGAVKRTWNGQTAHVNLHVINALGQQSPAAMNLGATQGGPSGQEGGKLFVGQLPFSQTESSIAEAFGKFGPVQEVFLHKDSHGQKKGACFVRFYSADHAIQALTMDGYLFPGSTRPITVHPAQENDAKRRRVS